MVERTFPDGLAIPTNEEGRQTTAKVATKNAEVGVTWVHSYVTPDRRKTDCIYDGPREAAIRQAAERNGLPVDTITPVNVLDPYFYNV
jgi:predicted amidohydrolase YtcJ